MKYPPALNPFRGTKFAWFFPLIWALLQSAAVTAPVTLEVFLHHRFGARSGKALLKGLILLLAIYLSVPSSEAPLFGWYVLSYAALALAQWLDSHQNAYEGIHSYRTGEPYEFWLRITFSSTIVRCVLEPLLCCLGAFVVGSFDVTLACWVWVAAFALSIKEQVLYFRRHNRQLDALDSRVEAHELAPPRARSDNETFVEARPAPPQRNRLAPGAHHPPPR